MPIDFYVTQRGFLIFGQNWIQLTHALAVSGIVAFPSIESFDCESNQKLLTRRSRMKLHKSQSTIMRPLTEIIISASLARSSHLHPSKNLISIKKIDLVWSHVVIFRSISCLFRCNRREVFFTCFCSSRQSSLIIRCWWAVLRLHSAIW